jgi:hypothetical protein
MTLPRAPKTPTLALPRKRGRETGEGIRLERSDHLYVHCAMRAPDS